MLCLIRGLPGGGKSTLARMFAKDGWVHIEKDKLRVNEAGEYVYDAAENAALDKQCLKMTKYALLYGGQVVVANTFVTLACLQPYIDLANKIGVPYTVIEAKGRFPNANGCPEENVVARASRWQHFPVIGEQA